LGTSIESFVELKESIKLYPNPVQDVLNIHLSDIANQIASVEILSMDGMVLYKSQLTGKNNSQINVSKFQQGIYLCRIIKGTSIETSKFLKQ